MRRMVWPMIAFAALLISGVVGADVAPETQFTQTSGLVTAEADALGDQRTIEFLSQRFDVPAQTLLEQKVQFGAEWGDLVLAYSFAQMARTPVTISQIFALRAQGLTWTEVSRFLRFGVLPVQRNLQTTVTQFQNQTGAGTTSGGTTSGGTTSGGTSSGGTTSGGTRSGGMTSGRTSSGGTTSNGTTSGRSTDGTSSGGTTSAGTTSGGTTSSRTTTSSFAGGVDRKVTTFMNQLESDAASRSDDAIERRLASRLGVSVDVLRSQQNHFDSDLGDLFVAHLILNRSRMDVSLTDLFDLRDQGLSWTQIARRYGIPPGRLLVAVRSGTTSLTSTSRSTGGTSVQTTSHRTGGSTQLVSTRTKGGGPSSLSGRGATRMHGGSVTKLQGSTMRGASATKMHGASATKMAGASATKMGGASATKMGGASITKMGSASVTKMGGASATRMGGAAVTRMGGASATRMGGGAAHMHGHGH